MIRATCVTTQNDMTYTARFYHTRSTTILTFPANNVCRGHSGPRVLSPACFVNYNTLLHTNSRDALPPLYRLAGQVVNI